ncbi:MAG: LLM class flavin-dependent oxidoreductase [SAR202 cluster bacterium]|jgi:probable F420-dependent oxidoreductase|nr:LLM class flavin-dependent oxidoreductase [SAR202 cluster bacterium]|tara:strand:+ start:1645 stop:2640 length:996 start_codon:yes stop_codon:yes gene_type:complete
MERIGVGFSGGMSPQDIVECVKVAEDLGYESAWVAEGHGGDQFSVLTACATATERIKLGTSITSVFVRTPPTIAMAAASVDYFSNGRFILGVGSSHKVQVEPEHGLEFIRPVQRLRECVDIIRAILKDSDVNYHGDIYDIDRFDLWFQPLRKEIPVFVAAVFPKMLEVCGEMAEGAILTWCTLDHAAEAAVAVGLGARNAGRDPADVEVASLLPCAVSNDRKAARDLMRMPIASYAGRFPRYRKLMIDAGFPEEIEDVRVAWQAGNIQESLDLVPSGLIDKIGLVGTADEVRGKLTEYRQAGITLPIVSPRFMGEGAKEQALEIIRACAPA